MEITLTFSNSTIRFEHRLNFVPPTIKYNSGPLLYRPAPNIECKLMDVLSNLQSFPASNPTITSLPLSIACSSCNTAARNPSIPLSSSQQICLIYLRPSSRQYISRQQIKPERTSRHLSYSFPCCTQYPQSHLHIIHLQRYLLSLRLHVRLAQRLHELHDRLRESLPAAP